MVTTMDPCDQRVTCDWRSLLDSGALLVGGLRMGYCFFCWWLVGSDLGHVELWHDCTDVNARLEQKKTLELEGMRQ